MANTVKIRNLVEPDKKDVCWNDILLAATTNVSPLRDLEYTSKRADLTDVKRNIKKLKRLLKQFEGRVNGELTESVERILNKNRGKYKGNADALMKYRAGL